jgi:hypothetical protein
MFTSRCGWILPEAETIACRSRFWIASTLTATPSAA